MSGVVLAIIGAFCFGLAPIFTRRAVLNTPDPMAGVLISVPLSIPFFVLVLIAMGRVQDIVSFPWQSYVWLSVAGITHFMGGRSLSYMTIRLLGANIASVLYRAYPVVATILGITVLDEPMSWQVILGVLLIAGGVGAVSWNPKLSIPGDKMSSTLPLRGILFGLSTGLVFGVTPLFIKMGLAGFNSPVAATFISYCAASIALSGLLLSQKRRADLFGVANRTFLFFFLSGLLSSIAHLLRYSALSIAPVSVVTPLLSTAPIFLLLFSFLFNRKIEAFNTAIIFGVITTVIGVILLAQ